jgi:two-component system sensor kinase FixL
MTAPPGSTTAFDALMQAAADAIIIIDDAGRILRFNPGAERIFGYIEAEVSGRNVAILMPEPHRSQHDEYIGRYRRTGKAEIIGRGREETGLRKDGREFPMLLSVGVIEQEDRTRFVGIVRDLSEFREAQEKVRQLEEQLLHADRLVILGELTAGIAHEINQPLTAIAAYADAARSMINRRQDAPREDMESICERIGEQSRRAGDVVQRLRKLVRSGQVSKAKHDINKIIRNVLLLFEYEIKKRNISVQFEERSAPLELYVDEVQIQQILVNLVKNSLDAMSESRQGTGKVTLRVEQNDADVQIEVTDNGPGVSPDARDRLFEAFFTTKPRGVGLGLSICRSIAAAHGGNLSYEPLEQGGSRFTLSLPLESIG